jgi:hypothetical protein
MCARGLAAPKSDMQRTYLNILRERLLSHESILSCSDLGGLEGNGAKQCSLDVPVPVQRHALAFHDEDSRQQTASCIHGDNASEEISTRRRDHGRWAARNSDNRPMLRCRGHRGSRWEGKVDHQGGWFQLCEGQENGRGGMSTQTLDCLRAGLKGVCKQTSTRVAHDAYPLEPAPITTHYRPSPG